MSMANGPAANPRDDVRYVIDVLRGIVDEEFKFTERLSATARQAFALAAAFVALAQGLAFGGFRADLVSQTERTVIVFWAVLAILLLVRAAFVTRKVDRFVPDKSLDPEALTEYLTHLYEPSQEDLVINLANDHLAVVEARRKANSKRGKAVASVQLWVGLALLATAFELVVSLIARIS
jgi:hypothetical protein